MSAGAIGEPATHKGIDMTAHYDFRTTTAATSTVPTLHRPAKGSHAARWIGPAAMAAFAVAALVGFNQLRSTDDATEANSPAIEGTTSELQPLIGTEEQAFIDGSQVSAARSVVSAGVEPLIGVEEQAFIDGSQVRVASLAPVVGVSGGFEPLIGVEEQLFIDGDDVRTPVADWCATHDPC